MYNKIYKSDDLSYYKIRTKVLNELYSKLKPNNLGAYSLEDTSNNVITNNLLEVSKYPKDKLVYLLNGLKVALEEETKKYHKGSTNMHKILVLNHCINFVKVYM